MQMEALECGAACLTMILAYYGKWVPLEQVRADCGVSRDGSKAVNILKAARSYGLSAKGMTYSAEALRSRGSIPCIIFWNFNHFVVLDGFKGKYAYLNDPARGQVKIPLDEFDQSFTGIALLFEPTDAFERAASPPSTAFASRASASRAWAAPSPSSCSPRPSPRPWASSTRRSAACSSTASSRARTPSGSCRSRCVMAARRAHHRHRVHLNAVYLVRIQGKIAVVSSSRFMRHLLHLPVGFYAQRMVGDLQQRQSANETIAFALVGQLAPVLINVVMLVLYLVIMLRYSVLLTVVGVVTVVLNAFLARYISKKRVNIALGRRPRRRQALRDHRRRHRDDRDHQGRRCRERLLRALGGLPGLVTDGNARMTAINEYWGAVPMLLTQLGNIAVLVLGIWLIVKGRFTPGALLVFTGFLASFMTPVTQIINLGQTVQEMQTQMERVEDVMRYESRRSRGREDGRERRRTSEDAREAARRRSTSRASPSATRRSSRRSSRTSRCTWSPASGSRSWAARAAASPPSPSS